MVPRPQKAVPPFPPVPERHLRYTLPAMKQTVVSLLLSLAALALGSGCATATGGGAKVKAAEEPEEPKVVLVGPVSREQVEAAVPEWVAEEVAASPDAGAIQALAAVEPGAQVTVYLGTWCSDSRRELSRLWRALDEAGGAVPFSIDYVGVDEKKKEPADLLASAGLRYVPTLVVSRSGREVGRIVEESPGGVERDLLALLDGSASGLVTAKKELLEEKSDPSGH